MIRTDNFRDFAYYRGEFNDVILDNYYKEAKKEDFDRVWILRDDGKPISKFSNDQEKINEILSLFEGFYLKNKGRKVKNTDTTYYISFKNVHTHESLDLDIENESCIDMDITLHEIKIDKKRKIIHHEKNYIMYRYEIQNGKIDYDMLDKIFYTMDDRN
jgi:hypothetical protein